MSLHSLRGSVPGSARTQVPTFPDDEQVWQVPAQAVWQQTPSAQKPEAHWAAVWQGDPMAAAPVPVCPPMPPASVVVVVPVS